MKKSFMLILLLICSTVVFGQNQLFSGQPKDSVVRLNARSQQFNYVPGVILVKFKDGVTVKFKKNRKGLKSSLASVNNFIGKYHIVDGKKLFPNETRLKSVQVLTAYNGQKFIRPSLNNIYKLKLANNDSLFQAIQALKSDSAQVEYAEPDYIFSIVSDKPESSILSDLAIKAISKVREKSTVQLQQDTVEPNDPLYSKQWYIPAVKADRVWKQTKGSKTQIIAILDTGVDWKHPDLKDKIWTNPGEKPGNGIDDNGDGYIDDVRGWDWINNDNDPSDDNSHGTHVAGIAAAEANNGIGIVGVDWNAQIMPLKVFQSSGRGDAATISKGIVYAMNHGATAINMSFGSYANSQTMQEVLANAYAKCILVAAAGNDGRCIGPGAGCAPFFPAALSFVLGVQSPEAGFSNYDQDGPTYSQYPALWNYEMKAPGTNVLSTVPGGQYRIYQGTSMATPIVTGAVCLYRQLFPPDSETTEFMWAKLIQSTKFWMNIDSALTLKPKPEIWFIGNHMVDTLGNDDGDGRVDAGETIQLWFDARNTGGQVDSVFWKIKLAEYEDTSVCHILKNTSYIGSISPYVTKTNQDNPMVFKISPNVAQGRDITFDLMSWYKGASDTIVNKFVFTAENGTQLSGVMDSTMILTPDRLYLVNNSFKVGKNGTLIIKPGTHILFYPKKTVPVVGRLIAEGKPDSLIYFTGYTPPGSSGTVGTIFSFRNDKSINNRFSYCQFDNLSWPLSSDNYMNPASVFNCTFINSGYGSIGVVDSVVNNLVYSTAEVLYTSSYVRNNNFIGPSTSSSYYFNGQFPYALYTLSKSDKLFYNNFINYRMPINANGDYNDSLQKNNWISEYMKPQQVWNGTFYQDTKVVLQKYSTSYNSTADFQKIQYQYWGTSDSSKIEGFIYDFMDNPTYPRANFFPYLKAPTGLAHGIVWKVLVDGKDAQDQQLDPLGVGKHRFDVYFNRPMDTTQQPSVAFGVRYPFSSNLVKDNPSWSPDGKIFTVYANIKLYTGDGINRIRVSGARDKDGWEIPLEDMRFNFLISAAQSSSLDFMATPGLGKVALEWNSDSIADLMGFNMYRMHNINDTTLSIPVLINKTLITDTLFTDYNVTPNKKYYYYYKVVRTDFSESDSSRVVSAVPYTASLGDANGDLSVNVLDLTTIVAYILGENPQPFIENAADINGDSTINVLDVIGVVKLILGTKSGIAESTWTTTPTVQMNDSIIQLNSDHQLAALQFELKGENLENVNLTCLLKDFEFSYGVVNGKLLGMIYNFNGTLIPGGLQKIIKIENTTAPLEWDSVFGSDNMGKYVPVTIERITGVSTQTITKNSFQVLPNPFKDFTKIGYSLAGNSTVRMEIFNLNGQRVMTLQNGVQYAGNYEIVWNGHGRNNSLLPPGIYLCRMVVSPGDGSAVYTKEIKIVKF